MSISKKMLIVLGLFTTILSATDEIKVIALSSEQSYLTRCAQRVYNQKFIKLTGDLYHGIFLTVFLHKRVELSGIFGM